MTALEYFRLVAPEFAAESDITVQSFLDLAPLYINLALYSGEQQALATALQAASLMVQRKKSATGASGGGTVIEEKEGDLMRKYSSGEAASNVVDIYANQLAMLSAGVMSVGILTRIGPYG